MCYFFAFLYSRAILPPLHLCEYFYCVLPCAISLLLALRRRYSHISFVRISKLYLYVLFLCHCLYAVRGRYSPIQFVRIIIFLKFMRYLFATGCSRAILPYFTCECLNCTSMCYFFAFVYSRAILPHSIGESIFYCVLSCVISLPLALRRRYSPIQCMGIFKWHFHVLFLCYWLFAGDISKFQLCEYSNRTSCAFSLPLPVRGLYFPILFVRISKLYFHVLFLCHWLYVGDNPLFYLCECLNSVL